MAMGTFGALVEALGRCVDAGLLSGDPLSLATIFFSLSHGLTSLALMGWFGPPEQADAAWVVPSGRCSWPDAVRRRG